MRVLDFFKCDAVCKEIDASVYDTVHSLSQPSMRGITYGAVIEYQKLHIKKAVSAVFHRPDVNPYKFNIGDRVHKTKGSSWQGHVVGFYSTDLTPVGYCVESENEHGSVQIYPEAALELVK